MGVFTRAGSHRTRSLERVRRVGRWSVAIGVFSISPRAFAEPTRARVTIDYQSPTDRRDCPANDVVSRSIAVRLGYDPFAPTADDHLRIVIRPRGRTLEAIVTLERGATVVERTRESASGDCAELSEVAAFTAATLVDPRAVFAGRKEGTSVPGESLELGRPLEPPPAPLESSAPPAPPPVAPLARERSGWTVRVGGRATVCVGCAPEPSLGFGVFAGIERARWGIDLGGRLDLPSSILAADGTGVSASLLVFEAFPHVRLGPLRFGPLGTVGTLSGKSIGVEGPSRESSLWMAAGARASMELRIVGPLFAYASVDGSCVLTRVHLVVRDVERWSNDLLAATGSVGVVGAF